MTAARIKTAELAGAMLDKWVARARGLRVEQRYRSEIRGMITVLVEGSITRGVPHYSTDWREAGPIIQGARISIQPIGDEWCALVALHHSSTGPTPLVAAMRAYVASRFGDEVEAIEGGR